MALERFLSKKLSTAEESNWLLENQDGEIGEIGNSSKRTRPAKWYVFVNILKKNKMCKISNNTSK